MSFFRQIIFPPKPKLVGVNNNPSTNIYAYEFDKWFVGTNPDSKVMYVKCPICGFTYEYMVMVNETLMRKRLVDFEPFHYREVIRKCPASVKHLENICRNILEK